MPLAPHCPQEKVQLLSQRFWAPTETSMAPPIPLSWDLVSPLVLISVVKTSASFTPKISAFSPLYLHIWSFSFLFFKEFSMWTIFKVLWMCYNIASVVYVLCFWQWDLSSLTRDQTLTLCFGRWSQPLDHQESPIPRDLSFPPCDKLS